jgi:hypothetical protein
MAAPPDGARVHLLAGLNGAGKTTYARSLERQLPAVRFTLDEWMLRLYRLRYDDPAYPAAAESCKELIWDVARQVLSAGTDVVLDWNQWSRARRSVWRDRAVEAGHRILLHYVDVPLDVAVERAEQRGRSGDPGAHVLDAAGVRHLAGIFETPSPDEGLELHVVND